MHPVIVSVGAFQVKAYGLMLAIAFWLGIMIVSRELKRKGISPEILSPLSLLIIISSLVGGRLAFVLTHFEDYGRNIVDVFKVWEGGLTFYGGVVLVIVVCTAYLRWKRLRILPFLDATAPAFSLGAGVTRLGCFLNGCCFGRPTEHTFGILFPKGSYANIEFGNVRVHPSQLYASLSGFLIFILVLFLRKRMKTEGSLFMTLLLLDSSARILIDSTRFYETGADLSKIVPYGLIVLSIAFLASKTGRKQSSGIEPTEAERR